MNLSLILFIAFIFLKPFYIFPSGSAGLGDIALVLCFFSMLYRRFRAKTGKLLFQSDVPNDKLFYLFIILATVINGIHFYLNRNYEFLIFTTYWWYAGMTVWCVRELAKDEKTFYWMNAALKTGLLIQLGIYCFGVGKIYYEYWGASRYMGTFNNPNQMAYIIFLMILLIYIYDRTYRKKTFYIYLAVAGFLIVMTKATGIFLGWMTLVVMIGLLQIYDGYKSGHIHKRILIALGITAGVAIGVAVVILWPRSHVEIQNTDYSLIARIQEKIQKLMEGGLMGIVYDRGWEKMLLYPQYLLFGSGEGAYGRFPLATWKSEIHSTIFSIWFCYGIIPLGMMIKWIFNNVKGLHRELWPVYIALLVECATVINYRQPFFWIILIYGGMVGKKWEKNIHGKTDEKA